MLPYGKGSVLSDKLEIVRSVTELDTIVIGGTSKLLKHIKPIINKLYPDIHELVYFVDYDKQRFKYHNETFLFLMYIKPKHHLFL